MMNLFCIPKWHGLNPKVASLLYSAAQFCHRPPRNNITPGRNLCERYMSARSSAIVPWKTTCAKLCMQRHEDKIYKAYIFLRKGGNPLITIPISITTPAARQGNKVTLDQCAGFGKGCIPAAKIQLLPTTESAIFDTFWWTMIPKSGATPRTDGF